jgi:hypothetical protein
MSQVVANPGQPTEDLMPKSLRTTAIRAPQVPYEQFTVVVRQ